MAYHEGCIAAASDGRGKDVCGNCWEDACYALNCTADAAGVTAYIASKAAMFAQLTDSERRTLAAKFAQLTDSERRTLAAKLRHAGQRFGDEANALYEAPAAVRAAYNLPRDSYHGFYLAAIECSSMSVEVLGYHGFPLTGTGWPVAS